MLKKLVILCLVLSSFYAFGAGRGTAGKEITKIFNDAAEIKKTIKVDQLNYDYNTPGIRKDTEKLSLDDLKGIKKTLPPKLPEP